VLTSYYVQAERIDLTALAAAAAATTFSLAQRALSNAGPARRRRAARVEGTIVMRDGTAMPIDDATLLEPIEHALGWMSVAIVAIAVACSSHASDACPAGRASLRRSG